MMKDKKTVQLPEFKNPPINEVVAGVFFKPIVGFKLPHFGLYWDKIKNQYPHFDQTDPIVRIPGPQEIPLPRVWLLDNNKTSLVQLQKDCLLFNWRRVAGNETYPRFSKVIAEFNNQLEIFTDFLREQKLPDIEIKSFELSYINHIPENGIWKKPTDIGNFIPDLKWNVSGRFLSEFKACAWSGIFSLPEDFGQLAIHVKHGTRNTDGAPLYVLELSAQGLGGDSSRSGIDAWFAKAHEWIVKGFCDFTSPSVQTKNWGRSV